MSLFALKQLLVYSPSLYSDVHWRPYGVLFRNGANADCHDANHAVILDENCDVDAALRDIEKFYRARLITPRVYASYDKKADGRTLKALERKGWTVECASVKLYQKTAPCTLTGDGVKVSRVNTLTNELAALLLETGGPWTIGMTEYLLPHPDVHAYAAYDDEGAAVSYAALIHGRGAAIIQDVVTRQDARRRGYCSAVIARILREFTSEWKNTPVYLFAENPEAIRVYERAGFVEISLCEESTQGEATARSEAFSPCVAADFQAWKS